MSARSRIHLMPVVMTAAAALLALKTVGFVTHTSYLFTTPAAASPAEAPTPEADAEGKARPPKAEVAGPKPLSTERPIEPAPDPALDGSASERALLEALKQRREMLDARAGDLDLRENLLKAAEMRMEERLQELKQLEARVAAEDARRADEEKGKLKELVIMYEGMKVKEAARIFDKLDAGVLLQVASQMNPRKMSEVLGQMTPDAAQKLTVALARRNTPPPPAALAPVAAAELPKIEGRPPAR